MALLNGVISDKSALILIKLAKQSRISDLELIERLIFEEERRREEDDEKEGAFFDYDEYEN